MWRKLSKHNNSWPINRKVQRLKSHLPHNLQTIQPLSLIRNPRSVNLSLTMSEPQNLVPNLNEIMEEYDELENETVQATHVVTKQGEETAKVNDELEKTVEESRKRKRGNEEAESSEQTAGDWVSDMAYIAWRDKLQHKDFIGERGFNKWVSPFQELIESKG